ncbi:MAG: YheC/YheD family protein [Bacillaceae bacterium]|nr:YheC/YheD family protein [Bacillaceae bacterium]
MSAIRKSIQVDPVEHHSHQADVLINSATATRLQIPAMSDIQISFGSCQTRAKVAIGETPLFRISQRLSEQLAIPNGIQVHVRYEKSKKRLVLGPILGIMLSGLSPRADMKFGKLTPFCREVVQTAKAKGIVAYVFSVEDINLDQPVLRGWIYRNHTWARTTLPYPDAVYNRLSSRSHEKKGTVQELVQGLKGKGSAIFNEQFLNKWDVYESLSSVPGLSPFIPETMVYKGFYTIKTMLEKYPVIYVKPTNGAMGRGIYRISRRPGHFLCQYATMNGTVSRSFKSASALFQTLSPRISRIPYLVQQGLHLIKQRHKPVDIRALCQKNREGKWSVTSIVARTGGQQNIVSNVARGGNIVSVSQVLKQTVFTGPRPSVQTIRSTALKICNGLEKGMPGHYAELGIDLGVDTSGRIWLLEVNSKPSKTDDTLHPGHQGPRPSVVRMLDYALYLGGFAGANGNGTARPAKRRRQRKPMRRKRRSSR